MTTERQRRNRVASRWAIASVVAFALVHVNVAAIQLGQLARRECTSNGFGAYAPDHR
jgi:hypothetical protein